MVWGTVSLYLLLIAGDTHSPRSWHLKREDVRWSAWGGVYGRRGHVGWPVPGHIINSVDVETESRATWHMLPSALTHLILLLKDQGGELDPSHTTLKNLANPS